MSVGYALSQRDTFTIMVVHIGTISPADATTYYFGIDALAPTTSATNNQFKIPYNCRCVGAIITTVNNAVQGSGESSTLLLRNNTTATSSTMGTFLTNSTATVSVCTTLTFAPISISANDNIIVQWNAPTYATNPTNIVFRIVLFLERLN